MERDYHRRRGTAINAEPAEPAEFLGSDHGPAKAGHYDDVGISNPFRYSRVSRRSASLSSTNFSALPSKVSDAADAVRNVAEVRQRRRHVAFEHVARQHLRIAGADRVDEVLVVRRTRSSSGRSARVESPAGASAPGPFSLFGPKYDCQVLPLSSIQSHPFDAVEQVADLHAAFVVREAAARAELDDRAVGVLVQSSSACRAFPATTRRRSSRRPSGS